MLSNIDSFLPERQIAVLADDEPIFWDILNGSTITYNPMVLFVNYYYWNNLPFYEDAQEYIFEMYANESVIFNSSNPYSTYNEYYWYLGFDWNISHYQPNTLINLTAFFYQETELNVNHTAWITLTIGEIRETPIIDQDDFIIDLYHWPGDYLTSGYYYYDPDGLNPYYHFAIYQDGYVEFTFGEREMYESNELSESEAKALMQELIDLSFFQLKNLYQAPNYDYFWSSYYQIAISSSSIDEWRQAEECDDFVIRPRQFEYCLQAIKDLVDNISFAPKRWKWDLFFIISGLSLGGLGVLVGAFYVFTAFKRRR